MIAAKDAEKGNKPAFQERSDLDYRYLNYQIRVSMDSCKLKFQWSRGIIFVL